jgi:hypothetical protein
MDPNEIHYDFTNPAINEEQIQQMRANSEKVELGGPDGGPDGFRIQHSAKVNVLSDDHLQSRNIDKIKSESTPKPAFIHATAPRAIGSTQPDFSYQSEDIFDDDENRTFKAKNKKFKEQAMRMDRQKKSQREKEDEKYYKKFDRDISPQNTPASTNDRAEDFSKLNSKYRTNPELLVYIEQIFFQIKISYDYAICHSYLVKSVEKYALAFCQYITENNNLRTIVKLELRRLHIQYCKNQNYDITYSGEY